MQLCAVVTRHPAACRLTPSVFLTCKAAGLQHTVLKLQDEQWLYLVMEYLPGGDVMVS